MLRPRFLLLLPVLLLAGAMQQDVHVWSSAERTLIEGLSLAQLPPLHPDPTNRFADDAAAAAFGEALFFDSRFSSNGKVSCGTCHVRARAFQDGIPLGKGVGTANRRTMPIAGTAYSPWQFWDGRKDSQWSQALGPLESPVEHGADRSHYVHLVARYYRERYQAIFGTLPDLTNVPAHASPGGDSAQAHAWRTLTPDRQVEITRAFANLGKAIAAFERTIPPPRNRTDAYAAALARNDRSALRAALTDDEAAGLRLFIGKARCISCHDGPRFTDDAFHNTAVPIAPDLPPDSGRHVGVRLVLSDEFNCRSAYSDSNGDCPELDFIADDGSTLRAYKTPSLRGVADRSPFMHAGQLATLDDVVRHYNTAPRAPMGHSELQPLGLTPAELRILVAYLRTL